MDKITRHNYLDVIVDVANNLIRLLHKYNCCPLLDNRPINLSHKHLDKIFITHDRRAYVTFFDSIIKYTTELNKAVHTSDFAFLNEYPYISFRVKNINSVFSKMFNYVNVKNEKGKVSIDKCLNDLFGVRIILPNVGFKKLYKELKKYQSKKILKCRIVNGSKDAYKAVHLYIKKDNNSFCWEIQLWMLKNERNNRKSHAKHKQEYTKWESEYNYKDLLEVL